MNKQQFEEYIKRVANNHNVSPQEVLQDMEFCIAESKRVVKTTNDPSRLDRWKNISPAEDTPTAYEFISHVVQLAVRQLKES